MILIDTSAWIEYLRDTGTEPCIRVDQLLGHEIATCDVVRMEILAGARDERHLGQLRRLLARATIVATQPADYDSAAAMYRRCRQRGETVRKLLDCLIGAIAVRADVPILHHDADFDVLARHTELQVLA